MTGSPEPTLVPVYGRVVTPDPWRHVTFVNYQNGCGRVEDWWNASWDAFQYQTVCETVDGPWLRDRLRRRRLDEAQEHSSGLPQTA